MNEKKQTKKPRKKLSKSAIVLIVGLCIIFIPLMVYGGILLSAQLQTGTPILGDRFKGDLDPAITNDDIKALEEEIAKISNVESVDIVLTSAQFRINVDATDSISSEGLDTLLDAVYSKVNQKLPISTYFKSTDTKKMYDLAINAYNFIDSQNEDMNYVILTKNAMMETYSKQVLSEPKDADLASELRGETVEPTPTPSGETVE